LTRIPFRTTKTPNASDRAIPTSTTNQRSRLPYPHRRIGKATPDTGKYPHTNTDPRQIHRTNQTAQTHTHYLTTGHIIVRDCITDTLNPHWEGDRNDQCQACDAGGTLTECTRCNIVWHASCLQPPLLFPLRKQDAIVCGDACWAELLDEYKKRGTPEPVKEDPLDKPSFLPRRHSETASTPHNYPSVTTRTPQGSKDTRTTSNHKATTRGQKRRARGQRRGKKKQPRLSAHIIPWTIYSSQRRQQSQKTTTVAIPPTPTASTAVTAKVPP
jgi:hypothetical protein